MDITLTLGQMNQKDAKYYEMPPLVFVGERRRASEYENTLVKHVVFSDASLARRWQDRIATLRGSLAS